MSHRLITTTAMLAVVLCLGINAKVTSGCAICVTIGDPFNLPHPHAIRIAVASRKAQNEGVLRAVPKDPKSLEADIIRYANHYFSMPQTGVDTPLLVDIFIIDEPVLYRIEAVRGRVNVTHMEGGKHSGSHARLVTTKSVIMSLGRLDLSVTEAVKKGFLEVEGDGTVVPGLKKTESAQDKTNPKQVTND